MSVPARIITFRVGSEWLGIAAERVAEVVEAPRLWPLPDPTAPGMMEWRGRWIPVVPGWRLYGGREEDTAVAVLVLMPGRVGVGIAEVGAVLPLRPGTLRPIPGSGADRGVLGVVEDPLGRLVRVVEIAAVLPVADQERSSEELDMSGEGSQIVTFRIGPQEFGLDVFGVREILRHGAVTPVPEAPDFVEGVVRVRGAFLPLVDLRKRFSVPLARTGSDARVVVVTFGEEHLGLVVDAVNEVVRVPDDALSEPPAYLRGIAARYVRTLARVGDRTVIVLDPDQILRSEERIALERANLAGTAEGEGEDAG